MDAGRWSLALAAVCQRSQRAAQGITCMLRAAGVIAGRTVRSTALGRSLPAPGAVICCGRKRGPFSLPWGLPREFTVGTGGLIFCIALACVLRTLKPVHLGGTYLLLFHLSSGKPHLSYVLYNYVWHCLAIADSIGRPSSICYPAQTMEMREQSVIWV